MPFEAEALRLDGFDYAPVPPRYKTPYFSHIMGGYAAGYYAYIWSEVLGANTEQWIRQHGGLTLANGDRLRATCWRLAARSKLAMFPNFAGYEARDRTAAGKAQAQHEVSAPRPDAKTPPSGGVFVLRSQTVVPLDGRLVEAQEARGVVVEDVALLLFAEERRLRITSDRATDGLRHTMLSEPNITRLPKPASTIACR